VILAAHCTYRLIQRASEVDPLFVSRADGRASQRCQAGRGDRVGGYTCGNWSAAFRDLGAHAPNERHTVERVAVRVDLLCTAAHKACW
jgi:hypothetical protein